MNCNYYYGTQLFKFYYNIMKKLKNIDISI